MKAFTSFALLLLLPVACLAQEFQDLDFEQAQLVTSGDFYPYSVAFSNAFPGWQATGQGSPTAFAIYDTTILDYNAVGIYDAITLGTNTYPAMFGKYSAYLESEFTGDGPPDAELAQTRLIPSTARSIWFATTPFSLEPNPDAQPSDLLLKFSMNGQNVPYVEMDTETNYVLWAADVSSLAGTVSEIRFALQSDVGVAVGLDDIFFSAEAVPEPGALSMAAMGISLLGPFLARTRRKV